MVAATVIAAAQYEVTNGEGLSDKSLSKYFNNTGGKSAYVFENINHSNIRMNDLTIEFSGGGVSFFSAQEDPIRREVNRALDCRDSAWGEWRKMGYDFPQFNGIPFGVRLPTH